MAYKPKVLVLFDGAGLARLGLEQAGLECHGVEIDEWMHYLSLLTGSGDCELGDATKFKTRIGNYDAVWASPPCGLYSSARTQGAVRRPEVQGDHLGWVLKLADKAHRAGTVWSFWVENVRPQSASERQWGTSWNAAQFLEDPLQNRQRLIGGFYPLPEVHRDFQNHYPAFELCPAITATEYKGCATDQRRASRFFGRRATIEECAFYQGVPKSVLKKWRKVPESWTGTKSAWEYHLYTAIGNGVPVYMAKAFGLAFKKFYAQDVDEVAPWQEDPALSGKVV